MDQPPVTAVAPAGAGLPFPRSVLLVAAGIVTLVVVALIVALALPNQPTEYPAGSPQAAFQEYYEAWERGDVDAAYGHLSSAVAADVSRSDYRQMDRDWSYQRDQGLRLVLLGADITGERAVLRIRADQFVGGGLGGERYSFERSILLVRESGVWLIDEPLIGIEPVSYDIY